MHIPFNLSHVFYHGSDQTESDQCLQALLWCLVDLNLIWLRNHPGTPSLYKSGVKYGRTLVWDPIPALYARKFGDCKSLSAALIAEKLLAGENAEPVFRYSPPKPDGSIDYHILVRTGDGSMWEDPSKVLGMGEDENARIYPQFRADQLLNT